MRKLRFIAPVILFILMSTAVTAEHLPENNVIGQTLIVEKDSNIVQDNLTGEVNKEYDPEGSYTVINMTKNRYFKMCVLPALLVFTSGLLVFALAEGKKHFVTKR